MTTQHDKAKRWQFGLKTILACMLLLPLPFALAAQDETRDAAWFSIAPCIGGTIGYLHFRWWGAVIGNALTGFVVGQVYAFVVPPPMAGTLWTFERYDATVESITYGPIILSIVVGAICAIAYGVHDSDITFR
jgi:hypothetical protein